MRILSIVLISAVAGTVLGAALGYIEVAIDSAAIIQPRVVSTDEEPAVDASAPRVEIDALVYNFGAMQRGTVKSHVFTLASVGGAPLTVRLGGTSCTCTVSEVPGTPIPPGESVEVKLEWSSRFEPGPLRQTATIHTNDPLQSTLQLVVEGEVTDTTSVSPRDLMFDKITAGESKSAQVFVMGMLDEDLEVSDPELSDAERRELFDVDVERVPPELLPNQAAKAGYLVTVTAKPGLPVGRFHQWLSLRTNMEDAERLEIPLVGRVVGDISVHGLGWSEEQGTLRLGNVKSGEGKSEQLNIVVRGEAAQDVAFEVVSCDPPELQAKFGEPRTLRDTLVHVPLTIEVPPGTRPMVRLATADSEEGRVVLKTTHPVIPELVLGVRFAVER